MKFSRRSHLCSGLLLLFGAALSLSSALAANVTVDLEAVTTNGKTFTSSALSWSLTGFMVGDPVANYGAPAVGAATPGSTGFIDSGYPTSRGLGNLGGIKGPPGYLFRAVGFDVMPSTDAGNLVYGGAAGTLGTIGLKYIVIGLKGGSQVVSVNVTDTARSPAQTGNSSTAPFGYWLHLDLSGTAFATTDIDTMEIVNVAQTGTNMNFIGIDNFVYSNLTGQAPIVTAVSANLPSNATKVVITGSNFDSTLASNYTVAFNLGATGTVNTVTPTQLIVTFGTPPSGTGSLTAIVTNPFGNSGSATQIATVIAGTALAPSIAIPTATNIGNTTASLGGIVTSNGGTPIFEMGVVYAATATNSNPLIGGTGVTKLTSSTLSGAFTVPLSGLTANTSYSFAAYATNAVGATYASSASTFTTMVNPTNAQLAASLADNNWPFSALARRPTDGRLRLLDSLERHPGMIEAPPISTSPRLKVLHHPAA